MSHKDNFEEEIMICACSSTEHQIVINKDLKDNIAYCHIHLNKFSFWERLIHGIKYIFGYKCKYGDWDEFILNERHAMQLIKLANFLKGNKNEQNT